MLFALSALFSSCTVYHSQAVDIPLIRHQNDLQIEGAISSTYIGAPAINTTATYSFNKWGAVQGHINWNGYMDFYLQTAFGSYLPIKQHYVIEGYVGYGLWISPEEYGIYHNPFLQFNTGWVGLAKEHIDVGFGLKTSCLINFFSTTTNNIFFKDPTSPFEIQTTFREFSPLIEPQVFIRIGNKKLKGSLRIGCCAVLLGTAAIDYVPVNVSIGISYKFEFKR